MTKKGNGAKKSNGNGATKSSPSENDHRDVKPGKATGDQSATSPKKRSRTAHLKPYQWKPGQSGNPSGVGKRKPSLVAAIIRRLNAGDAAEAEGVPLVDPETGKQLRATSTNDLADALIRMAMGGNIQALGALEKLLDRLDGRVPLRAELTGKDGDAIEVRQARDDIVSRIAGIVARSETASDPVEPN